MRGDVYDANRYCLVQEQACAVRVSAGSAGAAEDFSTTPPDVSILRELPDGVSTLLPLAVMKAHHHHSPQVRQPSITALCIGLIQNFISNIHPIRGLVCLYARQHSHLRSQLADKSQRLPGSPD